MNMSNLYITIYILLILIRALQTVVITEFKVPEVVKHGSDAELLCKYDLQEDEILYTIKWYKEETEFYRYEPKQRKQVSYFPVPGINIDKERSNYTSVILKKVNNHTSGTFACEVSVELTFTTALGEAMMLVKGSSFGLSPWPQLILFCTISFIFHIAFNCCQIIIQ